MLRSCRNAVEVAELDLNRHVDEPVNTIVPLPRVRCGTWQLATRIRSHDSERRSRSGAPALVSRVQAASLTTNYWCDCLHMRAKRTAKTIAPRLREACPCVVPPLLRLWVPDV